MMEAKFNIAELLDMHDQLRRAVQGADDRLRQGLSGARRGGRTSPDAPPPERSGCFEGAAGHGPAAPSRFAGAATSAALPGASHSLGYTRCMRREGHTARAWSRRGPRTAYSVVALLCVLLAATALAAPRRAAASAPDAAPAAPVPHAPSAIIIDRVTGRVLYGRGIHTRRPMASTTKIMTALLALERCPDLEHARSSRRSG